MPNYSLYGNTVSGTFQYLVQIRPDGFYYDGLGNLLSLGGGTFAVGPQGATGPQGSNGINGATGPQGTGFNSITNPANTRILTSTGTNSANAEVNLTFDGGTLSLHSGNISGINILDFVTASTIPSLSTGRLFYHTEKQSLAYYPDGTINTEIQIGRQLYTRVINNSGVTLTKGTVVKIQSATNSIPQVTKAIAVNSGNNQVVGLVADDILNGNIGFIINNGKIFNLNMASYSIGDILYLSDTVAGTFVNSTSTLQFSSRTNQIGYVIDNGTASGTIYVNVNNEDINLSLTDKQRNVLEGNVISGGVFYFAAPGITVSSSTTVNIGAAKGWIIDNAGPTTSILPTVKLVEYAGANGVTISNIASETETYFLLNSSGVLYQQTTFPTPQQRRQNIYLGKAGHPNKTSLSLVFPEPDIDISPAAQVRDMFTPIKLINNGVYPSAIGATLSFQTSLGTLWGLGIGYITDVLNPSSITVPAQSPVTFQYRLQSGGTYSNTTLIDPAYYDNNGFRTLIGAPTKQATNQRIFLLQNGIIRVQYGQTVYADLTTAIANVQTEVYNTFTNFRDNAILIGVLSVVSNASSLADTAQAKFLLVSKFGETVGAAGGLSTTTLQQAYNNSGEPEIVTNSTNDGVTFRRGSTADTDAVFQIQNGSGSNTFYVLGNGNTYLTSLHITGLTGSTLSLYVDTQGNVGATTSSGNGSQGPQGPMGGTGAGGALGYYGSFYDTTNQLNPTASTANLMTVNSTYESNGVSIVDGSKMTFAYSGTYNIQFSTVFTKSNSSSGFIDVWFSRNGNYITASNTEFSIAGNSDQIASWNFMISLNANDYIQLYWSSVDTSTSILAIGTQSNPIRPSVPSVILTAQQVMYTQLGPTGSQGATGPRGATGSQGPIGPIGLIGPQGTQGATGPQGVQGVYGNDGSNSSRWIFTNLNVPPTDPTSTYFNADIDSLNVISSINISSDNVNFSNYKPWLDSISTLFDAGFNIILQLTEVGNNSISGIYNITGKTDNVTFYNFTLNPIVGNGSLTPDGVYTISYLYNAPNIFVHANTLFVDPNGDDVNAIVGRIDKPWQTIGAAVAYLYSHNLADYTIQVAAGVYNEDTIWVFNTAVYSNNNTTIKLNGGVKINANKPLIHIINGTRVSIIGSDISDDKGNCVINGAVNNNIIEITDNADLSISNFALIASGTSYAIVYQGTNDDSKLKLFNVNIHSDMENIAIQPGSTAQPTVSIRNCFLSVITNDDTFVANIDFSPNSKSGLNGNWQIFNSRFYSEGTNYSKHQGHIITDCSNQNPGAWMTWSDVIFYSNYLTACMWYDNGNDPSFIANLDVVSPVMGNRNTLGSNGTIIKNTTAAAGGLLVGGLNLNDINLFKR